MEVLERIPAIAEAVQRNSPAPSEAAGEWKVHAHEPGHDESRTVRLQSYGQCRALALELTELGCVVLVCDPKDCPRLQMWPRAPHD